MQLHKPFLKTDCRYYFKFSSVLEKQVNLCYLGRMPWLYHTLPLNSKMGPVNSRTFSRGTIKRACVQVMIGMTCQCFAKKPIFLGDNKLSLISKRIRCHAHPQHRTALLLAPSKHQAWQVYLISLYLYNNAATTFSPSLIVHILKVYIPSDYRFSFSLAIFLKLIIIS